MADAILYHYVRNRMRELGFGDGTFHFEPIRIYDPNWRFVGTQATAASGSGSNGGLIVGETYQITTYQAGDDFSNCAMLIPGSGTVNTSGFVFVATSRLPTNWTGSTVICLGLLQVRYRAYNEWLFLTSRNVPSDLVINSDSHQFGVADATNYPLDDIYCIHEFNGSLLMNRTPPVSTVNPCGLLNIDLEFIRAIPEFNPLEEREKHNDFKSAFAEMQKQLLQIKF